MIDIISLDSILVKHEIKLSGKIADQESVSKKIYAFVLIERNNENKQTPSNRAISSAKKEIEETGQEIDFILVDHEQHDLEAGLRATLLHHYGDDVRNAFLSIENSSAHIWIDQKRPIDANLLSKIEDKSLIFLEQVGVSLGEISTTSDHNVPTKTACIRTIRQLAPVSFSMLTEQLKSAGFTIPSDNWLSRRLDSIRKSGQIIRLSTGDYALTLDGLKIQGTAKNRSSPDLKRMLALARRQF